MKPKANWSILETAIMAGFTLAELLPYVRPGTGRATLATI
jgi:hypothetical protein